MPFKFWYPNYVIYQSCPSHTCSPSVLHLLQRNKDTRKTSLKNLQKSLSQWEFILEKPHLGIPDTASGFQNEGLRSQRKQLQVRNTKLYLVENWHPLKACVGTPSIKALAQYIPVSCSIFPFLWPPYVWIFVTEDNALSKCEPPVHSSKLGPSCYLLKLSWIIFKASFHSCYSCVCSTILWAQSFFPLFLNMYYFKLGL